MQKQIGDLLNNLFVCQSQLANQTKDFASTGSPSLQSEQANQSEINQKQEDPLFDMINYNDDNSLFRSNLGSPAEPIFTRSESNSIDEFLSFSKGFESFDF